MTNTTYRILSCDGGGIRGVITAKLLQALDPSVIKNIDLFAGTSTGSIIALGLASGVPIDTIVELYSSQKACSKISSPICFWPSRTGSVGHLRLANRRSSPPRKRPRTSGTGYASWGRSCCFRNIAAMDYGNLLATYIPDITLADVWTERNKGIVTPSFQLSAVAPSGARQWAARLLNNLPNVAWMSGTKAIDAIPRLCENPKTPLAKRRDSDFTERMITARLSGHRIAAKPDRVGSGRVGRSSSGPTCECAGVARRWDELRGDCEGPVAGRRHHPHLVSPV